jgi:uncharacterized surface protein with fasciclin (FAS1) repeats
VLQTAQADSQFSTLAYAVDKAGLTSALNDAAANLTLFVPTNAAFDALASRIGLGSGRALVDTLAANNHLADLLNFHLLPQRLAESQLTGRPATLHTYDGQTQELIFVIENGQRNVWDVSGRTNIVITRPDVAATNGVLHVVSAVFVPRGVFKVSQMVRSNDQYFKEFSAALTAAVIQQIDGGDFTLFVPLDGTNTVTLTENVVRHHIVSGVTGSGDFPPVGTPLTLTPLFGRSTTLTRSSGTASRNGATVLAEMTHNSPTTAAVLDVDFYGTNGVIHTIDRTLLP